MIVESLYYLSGTLFFGVSTYLLIKIYFLFYKMTTEESSVNITYPEIPTTMSEVDKYRVRLIQSHVKTEDDVNKMSPDEIKKEYLKHEKSIIDNMSDHVSKMLVQAYAKSVCSILPIDDAEGFEKDLKNDVFVKSAVSEYLPPLYYKYGPMLAPITILSTTATHINYKQIYEKINQYKNGRNPDSDETFGEEESEESKSGAFDSS